MKSLGQKRLGTMVIVTMLAQHLEQRGQGQYYGLINTVTLGVRKC